ncbi:MAG: hypothetical protein A2Y88_12920 [Chloroflexi bacterium RBG_13_48_10]|nr:MAG: hypothetical protein A2Y88_12920 [Chloroflexi bacterium RBG_13_48_10]
MDLTVWEPHIRKVCGLHGFGCEKVVPGVPGTFPTFIVEVGEEKAPISNIAIVVKFFGPLFDGTGSFNIEREIGRWLDAHPLSIVSPAILADGKLDHDWQYLIFEYVGRVSIGQVRDKLSVNDWLSIAHQMGEYIHRFHALTLDQQQELPRSIQPRMQKFTSFIKQQRVNCQANHQLWNDLPLHLVSQIEGFLLPLEQLIDLTSLPHLIHADLTADHILGCMGEGEWQTLAVIDWGDAMTGNLLYELVALHLDLFHSDKNLLRACLEAYGLSRFYKHDFPRKAFSMVLLHQFPMPAEIYAPFLEVKSLHELAERLFAI